MSDFLNILGVKIAATNLQLACQSIDRWIKERHKTYVCIAPVATIVDCRRDPKYRKVVNNAGMTTPDGMPLVWIGRLRGKKSTQRTYGPDLMLAFCQLSQTGGCRHYFYGGNPETNNRLMERLQNRFPGIKIAGNFSPPLRGIGELEQEDVIERINHANPDILWVGLGSPKQDYWMSNHRDKLNVPVMVGVGAAFDFIAGTKPQAPRWMQRSGLEWLFRLCCEPKRLWKRYLIGNSQFIWYLLKDTLKKKRGRKYDS
jgi:N-acetylglucosaminyldiphosphoundecaprenol N-acetyl-beta-D-mannosaminyltransferase